MLSGAITPARALAAASVAVGSLTEVPELVPDAAAALIGLPARTEAPTDLGSRAAGPFGSLDAVPDLNGSADYKRHLAGELTGRALRRAVARISGRA